MSSTSSPAGGETQIGIRDRISVGIAGRVTQGLGDPGLEALRNHVFEPFGLVVNLVPAIAQHLFEKGLEQAVVTEHLQRDSATAVGQGRTPR